MDTSRELIQSFFLLQKKIHEHLSAGKTPMPLSMPEMALLHVVSERDGKIGITQLAEMFKVKKASVSQMAKSLVTKGYLKSKPSKVDKRAFFLMLSPRGKILLKKVFIECTKKMLPLFAPLSKAEQKNLLIIFKKITQ